MIKALIAFAVPVFAALWIANVNHDCQYALEDGLVWWRDGTSLVICGIVVYRVKWVNWERFYHFFGKNEEEWESFYFRIHVLRLGAFMLCSLAFSLAICMILSGAGFFDFFNPLMKMVGQISHISFIGASGVAGCGSPGS